MNKEISPLAGQPARAGQLVDPTKLVDAYYNRRPDPAVPGERVAFGTSGHRGSSFERSFNEAHVLAISQAICLYRRRQGIDGPLFIGIDTRALSRPAFESALEVLAANQVDVRIAPAGEYAPTPAVSHAILVFNRGRETGLLERGLQNVRRIPFDRARRASTTREHDFLTASADDLGGVVDLDAIRGAGIRMVVDPLGGAGVHYWACIAERYGLDLTVVSEDVDPTFRFMTLDWDGHIRMDPSSRYALQRLIGLDLPHDIAFACDTDHDRHGIVTRSAGLLPPNHYPAVAIDYLFRNRSLWRRETAVGKTVVSSAIIDRVTARLGRKLYEVPVGFKWFVDGLLEGALGFGGEESAGAAFLRRDGTIWTTDKDGIVPALLSAEITARSGRDPAELYHDLTGDLGEPATDRVEAPATAEQKRKLNRLSPERLRITELGGEAIVRVLDHAPGTGAPLGGIQVVTASGWFAARPSGTEDIYKIYAESFRGQEHLRVLLREAQGIVDRSLADG